ncbi:hypothetical protein [Paenibacillus polymyxa]|uniref:oxidoreductase n=1 Tax=Paenibacillus polymyxa TaxID=1406 RepID=UPI003217A433
MLEVHAVTQQGKDSGSLGIWSDEHISPLQKVVQAIHDQGSKAGLQLLACRTLLTIRCLTRKLFVRLLI